MRRAAIGLLVATLLEDTEPPVSSSQLICCRHTGAAPDHAGRT